MTMKKISQRLRPFLGAVAFVLAGLSVRYFTQFQIESRYLVLLFIFLAIFFEFAIRPALGLTRDLVSLIMNCAAATVGIIAMKWMLEVF